MPLMNGQKAHLIFLRHINTRTIQKSISKMITKVGEDLRHGMKFVTIVKHWTSLLFFYIFALLYALACHYHKIFNWILCNVSSGDHYQGSVKFFVCSPATCFRKPSLSYLMNLLNSTRVHVLGICHWQL